VSTQAAEFLGSGAEAGSHLVSGNGLISNGSFTFHAQDSELKCVFLTVAEVAKRLRVCRATVYRMIDKGQLQALRVSSGALRVSADESSGLQLRPAAAPPRRLRP
jgi:excisionase family DNA binding protein